MIADLYFLLDQEVSRGGFFLESDPTTKTLKIMMRDEHRQY